MTRPHRGRVPWPLAVVGTIGFAVIALPLVALILRAPWGDLATILSDTAVLQALWLSVRTALVTTLIALVLGVPVAWLLAHDSLPLPTLARTVVMLPMVLPPVAGGIALMALLGRQGLIGQYLELVGVRVPFTTLAVVIAQTFVAMPFLVASIEGALRGREHRQEQVAASLGASPWYTFRRVTLPGLRPAIAAGAALCFARALGEFGATITFAGNFPGVTQTMPTAIYLAREQDQDAAIALSLLLMLTSTIILIGLRSRWLSGVRGWR